MKDKKDLVKMLKEAGVLFLITLLAGFALGGVNELTKEPIARQQELKIQKACAAVFDMAGSFEEIIKEEPETGTSSDNSASGIGKVYRAISDDGILLGYVINCVTKEGYGGEIELMMGITLEGTLNGISILNISETPGLGMRAGEVLVPQFTDRPAAVFTYTKKGASPDKNEIDAISGATITTNAVTNAVNAGIEYFEKELEKGGNES